MRSGTSDNPVAADRLLSVAGLEDDFALADLQRAGLAADGDPPVGFGLFEQLDVGAFGAGELGTAVEDGDRVALRPIGGEAEGVLDPRIARSDHRDVLVDIGSGIVELVLDVRPVGAGQAQEIGIALRTDRQNHRFGLDHRPVAELDRKRAGRA